MDVSERTQLPGAAAVSQGGDIGPGPDTGPDKAGSTTAASATHRRRRLGISRNLLVILAADVVLITVSEFGLGINLMGRSSLSTLTPLLGVLILMSLAQGLVIGTGGIDLSLPATITLVGSIALKASGGANSGLGTAIALTVVACVVIGLVNGSLVEVFGLNALVVTLATGQLIEGITRLYSGPVLAVSNVPPALADLASKDVGGVSMILGAAAGCAVLLSVALNFTVAGRKLVASSASGRAAKLAGLAANRYRIGAWVLATIICGVGALLLAGEIVSPDLTLGDPYLLSTVVAVVLGGAVLTGGRVSPAGIAAGAVFISVLDQDLQVRGYSTGASLITQGIVLGLGLAALGYTRGWRPGQALMRGK